MVKIILIIVCCVVLVGVGVFWYSLTHSKALPGSIVIKSAEVTDDATSLSGYFSGSAMYYNGYSTQYRDGTLYVSLIVSTLTTDAGGEFAISEPNTHGEIKAVYLAGHGVEADKLIWSRK